MDFWAQTLYNIRKSAIISLRKKGTPYVSQTKASSPAAKKEEVNKKALLWIGTGIALLVILIIVLIVISQP